MGGISPSIYRGRADQFNSSVGIDPDLPVIPTSSAIPKAGGVLSPSFYSDISGANMTSYANWLITCPQDQNLYAYLADGIFLEYNTSFSGTDNEQQRQEQEMGLRIIIIIFILQRQRIFQLLVR